MASSSQREETLVRRAMRGEARAFDLLVEQYAARVYALAYRLLGNAEDAQDMAQEAFVRVYRALPRYNGAAAFSTWLYRIVTNVCLDEMQRRRRRPAVFTDFDAEDGYSALEERSDGDVTDETVQRRARQQAVQEAIVSLPAHYRLVLVLYDLQGFSYQEIATMTRQQVGTIKSRLNRARNLLREKMASSRELFLPEISPNH